MASLAAVATYASIGSTVLAAGNQYGQSQYQAKIAEIEAKQLEKQSIAEKATAVQDAKQERRRAELLSSRVRALVGKSGTAYSSPNVVNTISDIDSQGEYNALAALSSGYSASNSKSFAASSARARGRNAKGQGAMAVSGTILDGMHQRYA